MEIVSILFDKVLPIFLLVLIGYKYVLIGYRSVVRISR